TLRDQYKIIKEFQEIHAFAMESKKKLDQAKINYDKEKSHFQQLETTWFNNQAVVLASHLHDGAPCPVCGSHAHPEKARVSGEQITKEYLDERKHHLDTIESNLRKTEQANYEYEGSWKSSRRQLENFHISIEQLEDTKAKVVHEGKIIKGQIAQIEALEKEYDTWKKQLLHLEEDLKKLRHE